MISDDDLLTVTQGCFETQFSMPLFPARAANGADLSANITIEGAFNGSVSVAVGRELAVRAAGVMFEGSAVGDEEVDATLLEITNMIGGNVKALLDQPSRLGLPSAGPASRGPVLTQVVGTCEGQPVVVRLHAQP
jgi:Chemotaxis phosphatase CheX